MKSRFRFMTKVRADTNSKNIAFMLCSMKFLEWICTWLNNIVLLTKTFFALWEGTNFFFSIGSGIFIVIESSLGLRHFYFEEAITCYDNLLHTWWHLLKLSFFIKQSRVYLVVSVAYFPRRKHELCKLTLYCPFIARYHLQRVILLFPI